LAYLICAVSHSGSDFFNSSYGIDMLILIDAEEKKCRGGLRLGRSSIFWGVLFCAAGNRIGEINGIRMRICPLSSGARLMEILMPSCQSWY
jgi:hypothetical protein